MSERLRNGPILRERDRSRSRDLTRVIFVFLLLATPVFFYIWEQVQLYQVGQEIQAMERQRARLAEEGRKLDLERARLVALGRVERIARDKLGLVDGMPVEVLALDTSGRAPRTPRDLVARADVPRPPDAPAED